MLEAIEHINEYQKQWAVEMLLEHFGHSVEKKRVAIWGLAFKPGTDDLREASSFVIINELTRLGVDVVLYDPKAMPAAKQQLADNHLIRWSSSAKEAIDASVDALIIATEWDEFKQYPLNEIESALGDGPLIDGRNCYALKDVASSEIGYYYSVGRMPIGRCVSP
jgi:UDPglucose 6-dehydrogenase